MNALKLERRLKWYQITGWSTNHSPAAVAFVEATSGKKALQVHSSRHKAPHMAKDVWTQVPKDRFNVKCVGKHLEKERLYTEQGALVEVLPITRYQCSCGKVHVTETPRSGVWCSCGKRVLPVTARKGGN